MSYGCGQEKSPFRSIQMAQHNVYVHVRKEITLDLPAGKFEDQGLFLKIGGFHHLRNLCFLRF